MIAYAFAVLAFYLLLNAAVGWWWADPAAGYVPVCYATREVREILTAGVYEAAGRALASVIAPRN